MYLLIYSPPNLSFKRHYYREGVLHISWFKRVWCKMAYSVQCILVTVPIWPNSNFICPLIGELFKEMVSATFPTYRKWYQSARANSLLTGCVKKNQPQKTEEKRNNQLVRLLCTSCVWAYPEVIASVFPLCQSLFWYWTANLWRAWKWCLSSLCDFFLQNSKLHFKHLILNYQTKGHWGGFYVCSELSVVLYP